MNRIVKTFGSSKVILHVVHAKSKDELISRVMSARGTGADGVFISNYGVGHPFLLDYYRALRRVLPKFWIGLNLYREGMETGARLVSEYGFDGFWPDEGKRKGDCRDSIIRAREFRDLLGKQKKKPIWNGLYFGGVPSGYHRPVTDPESVSRSRATEEVMDAVVMNHYGLRMPLSVDEVSKLRDAIGGDTSLAIYDGITVDNIGDFLPFGDVFLVPTGFQVDDALGPQQMWRLTNAIHEYALKH